MKKLSTLLILLMLFPAACVSLAARGLLPDIQARRPPDVDLGPQLVLFDESVTLSTSLVGTDGRVHLFVIDSRKQLRHIEVMGGAVAKSEILGMTDANETAAIDAVEQPGGKLRVLVGDKQFVRAAPESSWQELKGNRCQRFLPIRNDLYCAFVIKGEEISAPKRTDYTVGLIFIIPWVSWSNTQAAKLVIAQESAPQGSNDSWIIRAVVDPENPLDAESDFLVGTDNQDMLHVLYAASRGGAFFIVGAYGVEGGAAGWGHYPELRYAQIAADQLVARSTATQDQSPSPPAAASHWLSIVGNELFLPPRQPNPPLPFYRAESMQDISGFFERGIRPLNRLFIVNKAAGNVSGLLSGSTERVLFDKDHLRIPGWGYWVEFRIDNNAGYPDITLWQQKTCQFRATDGAAANEML